ncbi:hypothetical protein M0R45_005488 [Rubus argutus]|uniref:Uncharacterized protein n=1 Tax=Rubus argutus TaxID=59490 RepID=A0AAW1YMY8_RUBAR
MMVMRFGKPAAQMSSWELGCLGAQIDRWRDKAWWCGARRRGLEVLLVNVGTRRLREALGTTAVVLKIWTPRDVVVSMGSRERRSWEARWLRGAGQRAWAQVVIVNGYELCIYRN